MIQLVLLALAFAWPGSGGAQVPVPPLTAHVIDQTNTLTPAQKATLDKTLTAFENEKGSQLAVLIVPTTQPEAIEQFALRVAETWRLGRKKIDDGVILLIAKNDRAMRIEVGYGLEGALNDATAKRIVSETMTPRFQQQDFAGGIEAGVAQIIQVIQGEPLPAPKPTQGFETSSLGSIEKFAPILFVLAVVLGGVLRAVIGKLPAALATGGVVALIAWFLMGGLAIALLAGLAALVATLFGVGLGRAGLGGGYLGGGRSGGFGGGGGGFGGGGASGRW